MFPLMLQHFGLRTLLEPLLFSAEFNYRQAATATSAVISAFEEALKNGTVSASFGISNSLFTDYLGKFY
jgi:hypothetical protein